MIIIMWLIMIIAIIMFRYTLTIQVNQSLLNDENKNKLLELTAITYANMIADLITNHDKDKYHDPTAEWFSGTKYYKEYKLNNFLITTFKNYKLTYHHHLLRYGLDDEESKMNLNFPGPKFAKPIITKFLYTRYKSIAPKILILRAKMIIKIMGWEKFDTYVDNQITQGGLLNLPFITSSDFLLYLGRNYYTAWEDSTFFNAITTHSCGKINLNTANKTVLSTLGLNGTEINHIFSYRKNGAVCKNMSDFIRASQSKRVAVILQPYVRSNVISFKSYNFTLNLWITNSEKNYLKRFKVHLTKDFKDNKYKIFNIEPLYFN